MTSQEIYGHIAISAIKPGEIVIFGHKLYYVVQIVITVDIDGNIVQNATCTELVDLPGMPDKLSSSTTYADFGDDFPETHEIPDSSAFVVLNPDMYDYNILY